MSVSNIHSLINSRWFIQESYGKSLLPSLFNILTGNGTFVPEAKKETEILISSKKSSNLVMSSEFDSGKNQNEYVAVIGLKNPIFKYNQECGPRGTKSKIESMNYYANDVNCVGVVLDIDSGGGQVSGTPEFHDYILNYAKPVVTYTDGLMCSAALYIGSAANYIIANKRADAIGSIGVMVSFLDLTGYFEKLGGKVVTEYSTFSTDKNRAFEELLKGKPELYIKTELDPIAQDFINDIKAALPNVSGDVFTGKTYNAEDSLKNNLIDAIGNLQDAIDKVYELASSENKNSNNPKNQKKKSMSKKTKSFPVLEKLVGSDGKGLATVSTISGKTGVQLSETQLDAVEAGLAGTDAAISAANGKVITAEGKVTTMESAVNKAIEDAELEAGLAADATIGAKIELLATKVAEYGKRSGAKGANPKSDGDNFEDNVGSVVNASDSHNKIYDEA